MNSFQKETLSQNIFHYTQNFQSIKQSLFSSCKPAADIHMYIGQFAQNHMYNRQVLMFLLVPSHILLKLVVNF